MVLLCRDPRPGARCVSPRFVRAPVRYWAEPGGHRIALPTSTRSRHQRTAAVGAPTGAKGPVAGARAAHADRGRGRRLPSPDDALRCARPERRPTAPRGRTVRGGPCGSRSTTRDARQHLRQHPLRVDGGHRRRSGPGREPDHLQAQARPPPRDAQRGTASGAARAGFFSAASGPGSTSATGAGSAGAAGSSAGTVTSPAGAGGALGGAALRVARRRAGLRLEVVGLSARS